MSLDTFDFLIDVRDALSKGISRHATTCAADVVTDLAADGFRVLVLAERHQAPSLAPLAGLDYITLEFAPYNEYFARFDESVLDSVNRRFRARHSHSFAQFLDPRIGNPSTTSATIHDLTRLHFGRSSLLTDEEFFTKLGGREFANMERAIEYFKTEADMSVENVVTRMEAYIRCHAQFVLSHCEFVCVPSKGVIEELGQYLSVGELQNVCIQGPTRFPSFYREPSSVRRCQLSSLDIPQDFVLFVGTPDWHKRLDLVLDYLADGDGDQSDCRTVVVVGDEAGQDLFERLDGYRPREGQVVRLGYVPDDVLRALYAEAVFTVIPSVAEGYCLPLDEALLAGGRVVCTDLAIFQDRVALAAGQAVVYSPGSCISFWDAIRRLPDASSEAFALPSRRRAKVSELLRNL